MADSSVAVTAGTGTAIDTRTEATNGHHRQVVILGDPSTNAGVAPVDATAGLKVDLGADNDVVVSATNLDIRDLTNADVVTAELSATDNAVLDAIEADTTTIAGDTTSIDAKIPALGQALAAASVPVILPAATITTLTPPAAITGFGTAANQTTIIGHLDGVETSLSSIDGKITAVNTGAVVVSSSALPTGASTAAKQPALGTAGTPSADVLTVQGVTSMTALKVDGSAVTQPVSGTVAVTNSDITSIKTAVEVIDNAISGSEMQVDVVAALPAGTNAIGKLAANSGVDIGDVDVTSVPRSLSGPGQPGTAIDSYTQAAISAVTGTDQSLIAAPGANKQIWVYGIGFTCSVAGTVAIQDEDNTAITGVVSYAQYSGPLVSPSGNFSMPLWKVATNKALEADVTTATINGWINYAIISV